MDGDTLLNTLYGITRVMSAYFTTRHCRCILSWATPQGASNASVQSAVANGSEISVRIIQAGWPIPPGQPGGMGDAMIERESPFVRVLE